MNELDFFEKPEIEEAAHLHDFKKRDFTKPFPQMANLNYDPFPNANDDDIVRTEIIGRDLVLRAKLKGSADAVNLGTAIEYGGNKYALKEIEETFLGNGECFFDVTGVASIGEEPIAVLARLRLVMATGNKN